MLVWRGHSLRQAQGRLCPRLTRMGMRMRMMPMLVIVFCTLMRRMLMRMRMRRLPLPIHLPRQILLPIHPNVHLNRRNPAAHHARNFQPRPHVQRRHSLLQQRSRNSGVHQRAQKHVAADARETLKIGYAHKNQFTTESRRHGGKREPKSPELVVLRGSVVSVVIEFGRFFIIGNAASCVKPVRAVRSARITIFLKAQRKALYRHLEHRLARSIAEFLHQHYPGTTLPEVVIEQPPKVALGDFATPLFPLAKPLRTAPLKIAEAIRAEIGPIEGIAGMQVAPPGYLNVKIDRSWMAAALAADQKPLAEIPAGKILVEHTSINPNKAAHIGHLRNAILGDTFVRLLRYAGREVDIQNYIDNTGVQVADVVVGFTYIEKNSRAEIEALVRQPRFDYYCWDLYARVSQWYAADKANLQARARTLHAIEDASSETATIAELISTAVLRRHLETMDRLDIEYDFLPREIEILQLHLWQAAFIKLKTTGVLTLENEGKNKGCWIMRRAGTGNVARAASPATADRAQTASDEETDDALVEVPLKQGVDIRSSGISEEDQKVIVRSNGTVGYVGKDIAYHMWKFGLLGRDFAYRKFYRYPNLHDCWISAIEGAKDHPHFADVAEIYNVIDARQSEAQNTVIEPLPGLGHNEPPDHSTHFPYALAAPPPPRAP